MSSKLKLPPYAKDLANIKEPYDYIYIFMGVNAWERAKSFRQPYFPSTLVLPPDKSVYDFSWPVANQDVWLLNTNRIIDPAYMREVAICILNHQAKSVRYVDKRAQQTIFKKGT